MDVKVKGMLIAGAVAALAGCGGSAPAAAQAPTGATVAKVKCTGVNECKAKGVCAQADHACGGKNECKGKGVLLMPAEECATKGGKTAS